MGCLRSARAVESTSVRQESRESVEVSKAASATRLTPATVETEECDVVRFLGAVGDLDGSKSLMAKGEKLVSLTFASWNHVTTLLVRIQALTRCGDRAETAGRSLA